MNNLFKNLTPKSQTRMKSRRTSNKIIKYSSSPIKVVSEECKLKEFLFNINKNYDNQINFIEFMNVVTLQFIKNKNQKKTIKHINTNLILKLAKKGELPEPSINSEKKKTSIIKQSNEFHSLKEGISKDIHKRSPSQVINDFQIFDKKIDRDNQIKKQKIYGDEEFNVVKDGSYILINDKRYDINSFKENIYIESTYIDELVEDSP